MLADPTSSLRLPKVGRGLAKLLLKNSFPRCSQRCTCYILLLETQTHSSLSSVSESKYH